MAITDSHEALRTTIYAGALDSDNSKRTVVTVGTSVVQVTPNPVISASRPWLYLLVINNHATAMLSINMGSTPTASTGSLPGLVWGNGQDIAPGQSTLISLADASGDIYLLSDTASTPVVLNLIA